MMSISAANLLRLLSISAVLLIHATAGAERHFLAAHQYFSESFLAVLLNQACRFAVPVFLMLSGSGLAAKYADGFHLKEFIAGRALKIALPFFIWSIVFGLMSLGPFSPALADPAVFIMKLGRQLVLGSADYHFYFFIIILQCYALFPLLLKIRSRWVWVVLLVLHLMFMQPSHYVFSSLNVKWPAIPGAFAGFWIFYFYSGICFAKIKIETADLKNRILAAALLVAAFGAVAGEYIFRSYHNSVPDFYNHFNRYSVFLYSFAVWHAWTVFGPVAVRAIEKHSPLLRLTAGGAALSFTVYIFHTQILRVLESLRLPGSFFQAALLLVFSFAAAYLIHRLPIRPAALRLIFGLPKIKVLARQSETPPPLSPIMDRTHS